MILHRLMLIADTEGTNGRPLPDVIVRAAHGVGGQLIVQFRDRQLRDAELIRVIRAVQRRVPPSTVLTVNNRPALARALEIGLHLPASQEAPELRPVLLGRSLHNADELRRAVEDRVDYGVIGTVFETTSHPGRVATGLDHLRDLGRQLAPIPSYAIGGITVERAAAAIEAGAWGVAVRTAILSADDPSEAAYQLHGSLLG